MCTTHKAMSSWITRGQKTAKTECGRTVKTASIAIDSDATCTACREVVDTYWAGADTMLAYAKARGLDEDGKLAASLEDRSRRYHTIYFL